MTTSDINNLFNHLKTFFESKDYVNANKIFSQLKIALITNNALLSNTNLPSAVLIIVRESLEMGAYLALFTRQLDQFTQCLAQLSDYYRLCVKSDDKNLSNLPRMYPLLGLELLRCLVHHQLATFHRILEWLPPDVLTTNPYITGPLVLEQALMEGSFHKAWAACANIPGPEYQYFMELMMNSLREELADCIEKSNADSALPVKTLAKLLFCSTTDEVLPIIKAKKWQWEETKGLVWFPPSEMSKISQESTLLHLDDLIDRNLYIARELERIV